MAEREGRRGSGRRWIALLAMVALVLAALGVFLVQRRGARDAAARSAGVATVASAAFAGQPRLLFRQTGVGALNGRVAMVSLADPHGPRAVLDATCERLYVAGQTSLCLYRDAGVVTRYFTIVGDQDFRPVRQLDVPGFPSRARVSVDGSLIATTTFVSGDSYLSVGFSTRTYVTDLRTGASLHLEDFTLIHQGEVIAPADRNLWGVTFASDDRTFFVTAAWSGTTWLAKGDLQTRVLTTMASNVECPSLSPDGTRIAFKKRVGLASDPWRIMIRDLATGLETPVAESRSVDDQMLWLDNSTIAYSLPRVAPGLATSDVWSVPADGSGSAQLLVEDAYSPTVLP